MPRKRKPARLYLRPDDGMWIIRDGDVTKRTGFGDGEREQAEGALQEYLENRKLQRRGGPAQPSEVTVGEVIALYVDDRADTVKGVATLASNAAALARFWGDLTCDAIKKATCAAYERERAKPRKDDNGIVRTAGRSVVRRELGVLQAALNHAKRDGVLIYAPEVTLPPEAEPRDRWLTRQEAAKLIRAADKHTRRFILVSLYTGRRMSAVLELTWTRVDPDGGVIRFRVEGQAETKKRRGSVKIPRQLAGHLRRWRALDAGEVTHVVHYQGGAIASIKKAIRRAVERADLDGRVSAHTLKHTSITWAISTGLGVEAAAEYFDTSPATIRKTYWHHSPHHQAEGVAAMEKRG